MQQFFDQALEFSAISFTSPSIFISTYLSISIFTLSPYLCLLGISPSIFELILIMLFLAGHYLISLLLIIILLLF
jgi:hypothetical protein